MACTTVAGSCAPCLTRSTRVQRPAAAPAPAAGLSTGPMPRSRPMVQQRAALAGSRKPRSAACAAAPMPIAELAGEFTEITGYATVMFAITLVGLAVGFVLLRFEALVEEGKLDDVLK